MMKVQSFNSRMRLLRIMLSVVCVVTFAVIADAQDEENNIRKTQEGLVTNSNVVVSDEAQEEYGLVGLSNGCSASLLRNDWVITAAHCLDEPAPGNPDAFILVSENSVTVTANWRKIQSRQSTRIISFRPIDVALIRVDRPFLVHGQSTGYHRDIYRGALTPVSLVAYGRGISQFAQGSGDMATPAKNDGLYRAAILTTDEETDSGGDALVWFPSVGGQIAGGDSGGPSFAKVGSEQGLFGVHARCKSTCLPGKSCANNNWAWVTSTPRCADAPVAVIWDEIDRYLGALVHNAPSEPPSPFFSSNDFNDDGHGDILWHNASTGESQVWFLSGSSRIGRATISDGARPALIGPPWAIVGSRDFNGDGKTDLLWHNSSTGETQIWQMNGHTFSGRATVLGEDGRVVLVGLPWSIVGTNDMNGDKKADIIWHNRSTGETQFWQMNGYRVSGRATVVGESGSAAFVGLPWRIVGSGDFNGDRNTDLLWHNGSTGETQIWLMNGHRVSGRATVLGENGSAILVGLPWRIAATDDFNRDGSADILWHNGSSGEAQIWFMNGRTIVRRATVDADRDGGGAFVGLPWSIMSASPEDAPRPGSSVTPVGTTISALAAQGAAIAGEDPVVAAARNAEPDVYYQQGFDIATAIFGDPALGAKGNTQTGPGSLGIRDSLNAAGQRGFNASVRLHLSRDYKRASGVVPPIADSGASDEAQEGASHRDRTGGEGMGTRHPPDSPVVTRDDSFGTRGSAGRVFQPENTVKVSVRYKKEFGYLDDTNAFGNMGPTSCRAFSVSVVVGDGSAQQLNPIRISSDSKMTESGGYYFCSYLASDIPLNQPFRVSVGLSGLDQSAAWRGGRQAQPPPGQQRTIIIVSGREGGPMMLTATQPRARQLFEMIYTSQPR